MKNYFFMNPNFLIPAAICLLIISAPLLQIFFGPGSLTYGISINLQPLEFIILFSILGYVAFNVWSKPSFDVLKNSLLIAVVLHLFSFWASIGEWYSNHQGYDDIFVFLLYFIIMPILFVIEGGALSAYISSKNKTLKQ